MSKYISYKNDTHMELALMALAASQSPEDACAFLADEHKLETTPPTLQAIARMRPEQYEELRARIVPLKEKVLTHNLLDNALYASEVTREAMAQLKERLEEKKIPAEYLSRAARDMQDVQSKATEKKLALEGRPNVITETRSAPEIIRALEEKGIFKQAEQIEGTAVEED